MSVYTVAGHESRIENVFKHAASVSDPQIQADMARYLCVLVSGFIEQAARHIYREYAVKRSHPNVGRMVERHLEGFTNANATKLCQLAGSFNASWAEELKEYLEGQRKDAVDSVIANRHNVAHGRDVGLTYVRMRAYYDQVKDVVAYLEAQCA